MTNHSQPPRSGWDNAKDFLNKTIEASNKMAEQSAARNAEKQRSKMLCPNCHSDNTQIVLAQSGGKTSHKGTGFGGKTNNAARGITAVHTLGMSNLFWKSSKGTSSQKFKNEKRALCQDCGNDWKVK